jgi:hypothetical protein
MYIKHVHGRDANERFDVAGIHLERAFIKSARFRQYVRSLAANEHGPSLKNEVH